jgi:DNA-binding NtrC family response regulator
MSEKMIFITDDEPDTIEVLKDRLTFWDYGVEEFQGGPELLKRLKKGPLPDVMFLDIQMPGMGGMEVLAEIRSIAPSVPVIMMTAHGTTATAIEAIKCGAHDYILKPFSMPAIEGLLKSLFSRKLPKDIHPHLIHPRKKEDDGIVGSDARMLEIYKAIGRMAPTDMAVLIRGESGTGKELIAHMLHRHSARAEMPFTAVNCAAIPETLFESELFGYERGAFTGANERKIGFFERAQGGTLFLDEIGDIAMPVQAKILRVLQEKEFERLGGTKSIQADVRIVAATSRNLEDLIAQGRFREDLYFRLNGVTFYVPPLRERRNDIIPLAEFFIHKHALRLHKKITGITLKALTRLSDHSWPGNVRELENILQRVVVRCQENLVLVEDIAAELSRPSEPASLHASPVLPPSTGSYKETRQQVMREWETRYIREALQKNSGNVSQTARTMGLHRQRLQSIMKKLGFKAKDVPIL